MQQAVAVPVGVLAALAVVMFIFMFWWFPRHWQKGVRMDMAEVDQARRERELAASMGETGTGAQGFEGSNGMVNVEGKTMPKVAPRAYIAPVTPY